jgi:hypothetical protein
VIGAMKRPSRIVVRGQSAKEMIEEINNPRMSKEQLALFRKAMETRAKLKKSK